MSAVFSIILPVYNGARHLRDAIESVKAQSFPDWELVALDDGSHDESVDILNRYAVTDSRIRVETHPNCGVAVTRNRGLELARGRYVTFLDQDDWMHPAALARFFAVLSSSDAEAVGGRALDFLTSDGAHRYCAMEGEDALPTMSSSPVADTLHPRPPYENAVRASVWARAYLRSSIAGLRFPDGVFGADDWVFTMRVMAKIRRYASLPSVVYLHRAHPGSVSAALPMRYLTAMLGAVRTVAGEWCSDPSGPGVPKAEFADAMASHVQLWGLMLPCLKRYAREEMGELKRALDDLRRDGLLPFASFSHRMRYFLVVHGMKALLPILWRRRFRNMLRKRANHAEELG